MKQRDKKRRRRRSSTGDSLLLADPSRTGQLRSSFASHVDLAFARLRGKVVKLVLEEDAFGLKPPAHNANPHHDARGRFAKAPGAKSAPTPPPTAPSGRATAVPTHYMLKPPATMAILGDVPVHQHEFLSYLQEKGREFTAAPLPKDVRRGTQNECFKNASLLAMEREDLQYVEGIGHVKGLGGIGFLHAWCVDKEGKVVDPTWKDPQDNKYFGVQYDKDTYLKHIMKTKMYGVFGGDSKVARAVLERGGL